MLEQKCAIAYFRKDLRVTSGTDGRIYKSIGMPSVSLRKLETGEHLQMVRSKRKHQRKAESED